MEKPGGLKKVTRLISEVSSGELEWGQVLVGMKYAPVDSADIYTVSMGLNYGEAHSLKMPCVAGNRGFGVILKVWSLTTLTNSIAGHALMIRAEFVAGLQRTYQCPII